MVLESVTNAVRSTIAGRLNSAVRSKTGGIGSLSNTATEAATSALGNLSPVGKFNTEIMSYPSNVDSDPQQGHYILFNINEFTPGKIKSPKVEKSFDAINSSLKAEFGNDFEVDEDDNTEDPVEGLAGAVGETVSGRTKGGSILAEKPTVRSPAVIALYMPPSVQVEYEVKYTDQEIGTLAMLGKDAITAFMGAKGGTESKLNAVAKSLGGNAKEGFTNLLNNLTDGVASGSKALQQIESGKVITPRMEMMFEGVGRRSFSYTFAFIPKSAEEAKTIEKIIHTFKVNMMPEYSNKTTRREMNIPNTFDITYMYQNKRNGFINRISSCFLQKIDVQYGADRYTAYEPTAGMNGVSPPPQKSQITLNFTELETLSKDMVKEGF